MCWKWNSPLRAHILTNFAKFLHTIEINLISPYLFVLNGHLWQIIKFYLVFGSSMHWKHRFSLILHIFRIITHHANIFHSKHRRDIQFFSSLVCFKLYLEHFYPRIFSSCASYFHSIIKHTQVYSFPSAKWFGVTNDPNGVLFFTR